MKTKIYILYALMSIFWGMSWYFLKVSLIEMPLLWGLSIRFLIAGIIFWGIYYFRKDRVHFTPEVKIVYLLITFFNYSLCYILTYWGLKYIYSNLGSILWSLFPLCVAVMAHYYLPDEKISIKKFVSIAIGLIGTILLLYEGGSLGGRYIFYGISAMLLSIILAAWPNVYLKIHAAKINPFHLNAVGMTTSGLIMMAASLMLETGQKMPLDGMNLFALFFLTVPGTVVTWGIYIWLFTYMRVSQISYVAFFPPVIAIIMGWLLLDEKLPVITIIGAGLIILGGFLINYNPKNRKTHIKKKLNPLPED